MFFAEYEHAFAITRLDSKKRYLMVFSNEHDKRKWMFGIITPPYFFLIFFVRYQESDRFLAGTGFNRRCRGTFPLLFTIQTLKRRSSMVEKANRNSAPVDFGREVAKIPEIAAKTGEVDFGAQLVLVVKAADLTITSRVTLESKVEGVIMRLKLKVPGHNENYKLYLGKSKDTSAALKCSRCVFTLTKYNGSYVVGKEPLDPAKKMGDYARLRYIAEALNMSKEVM